MVVYNVIREYHKEVDGVVIVLLRDEKGSASELRGAGSTLGEAIVDATYGKTVLSTFRETTLLQVCLGD